MLTHPNSPDASEELRDLNTAAKAIGQELLVVLASSDRDFEAAFDSVVQHRAGRYLLARTHSFSKPVVSLLHWRRGIASRQFMETVSWSLLAP